MRALDWEFQGNGDIHMLSFVRQWRAARVKREFARLGSDCVLPTGPIEVKGHIELGRACVIGGNVVLRTHRDGKVVLGDEVELGDYAMIHANQEVRVGAGAVVGPYCVLRDLNHWFHTETHWRVSPPVIKPIVVGEGCFLGAHTYVMPGVTIGSGAVVAPGSVVNHDIGENEVWAGAPTAQFIAHRTNPSRRSSLRRHQALLHLYGFDETDEAP